MQPANHPKINLRTGVLLTQLGTPDAPSRKAVKRYLAEFLGDSRVVEIPKPIWWLILHGIILPFRSGASAKLYKSIWTDAGSPLLVNSQQLTDKLQRQLGNDTLGDNTLNSNTLDRDIIVELGMRYGEPSIEAALANLQAKQCKKIIVLPLFPQYAASTVGASFDAVTSALQKMRWVPELQFINSYADNPNYINAIADSIRQHWQQHGKAEKLILSFHGLPEYTLQKGDPYHCYCQKTARLIAESLGLTKNEWQLCFQSRFGRTPWLQPYTDVTLEKLGNAGTQSIDICCPGFSVDCLETLEEIIIRGEESFTEAGGEKLNYIPCLNTSDKHVAMLASILQPRFAMAASAEVVTASSNTQTQTPKDIKESCKREPNPVGA